MFFYMHQSFVTIALTGPGSNGDFSFFLLPLSPVNALYCRAIFVVKTLPKVPLKSPPDKCKNSP